MRSINFLLIYLLILHKCRNVPPLSSSKLSHPIGRSGPHLIYMVPWVHPSPQPKRHVDRFSRFCRAHDRDRQTDHATPSVTIGGILVRSTAMRPNNSFVVF